MFWTMVVCCFLLPAPILAIKKLRTITGTVIAARGGHSGKWLERFLIIVPTLSQPRLTFNWGSYRPTLVEITIAVGTIAYFILLYAIFTKLFPIIAVWEYKEGLAISGEPENHSSAAEPLTANGD
jgi:Ni/Fe-hydrogenase subunit HybB-like protein